MSACTACWRAQYSATGTPAACAASSAGVPCSSVPHRNSTSWPVWRRKRAWMSAGSSEPARLPRCLTPVDVGQGAGDQEFAHGSLQLLAELFVSDADMKKPFAQEGPERARAFSARASAFRAFLPKGTAHSKRADAGERSHDGNIVHRCRRVNARRALIMGNGTRFRARFPSI